MQTTRLRLAVILCLAALSSSAWIRAEDSNDLVLPATFEAGSLRIRGFAGELPKRVGFKIELLPDGTLSVETNSLATTGTIQKARLTKEQTRLFYDSMVKIVSESDRDKTVGAVPDGWDVCASIKLDGRKKERTYESFDSVEAISPGFRAIRDLIEKELPGVSLSAAELSKLPPEIEERVRIDLPTTFEKGSLYIKATNGGKGEKSSFGIEVLPDGTLHVECKPFMGKNAKMTGQLTKEQTRQAYDAMVKIVGRGSREVVAGGAHCWITTAGIRFDEDGTKQEQRTFVEFDTLRLMSPHFIEIIDLVAKALPESPIRQVAKLSPVAQPATPEKKKGEIVLPETFEKGSLHLTGSHGGIGAWSSFAIDLLPDGSLHVVVKPLRKEQTDRKAQLTKEQVKKVYDATAKFIRGPSKRSAGFEHGWDGNATIKLDKEGTQQTKQNFWGFRAIAEMSPEIDEILDLLDKAVPDTGIDRLP